MSKKTLYRLTELEAAPYKAMAEIVIGRLGSKHKAADALMVSYTVLQKLLRANTLTSKQASVIGARYHRHIYEKGMGNE